MRYNKLVRDNIPDIIRASGGDPVTHVASTAEYWRKLKEKLIEEVHEFVVSEQPGELADIAEVIEAICTHKKFPKTLIDEIRDEKAKKRGTFSRRIILEETRERLF